MNDVQVDTNEGDTPATTATTIDEVANDMRDIETTSLKESRGAAVMSDDEQQGATFVDGNDDSDDSSGAKADEEEPVAAATVNKNDFVASDDDDDDEEEEATFDDVVQANDPVEDPKSFRMETTNAPKSETKTEDNLDIFRDEIQNPVEGDETASTAPGVAGIDATELEKEVDTENFPGEEESTQEESKRDETSQAAGKGKILENARLPQSEAKKATEEIEGISNDK